MEKIYEDIAKRTGGDIYVGVVGPVRSGKSTFIKRFMEVLVIPNIENAMWRERARDELPQSGSGRTIMTAEPKFVPEEAVEVTVGESAGFSVRMIDSVGYMVDSAIGQMEDGRPRMVNTPWLDYEVPMTEAAEMGTRKVISEHSTIGVVVTTDGSITDIPREDYIEPEDRVIGELKTLGKPFVIIVNSMYPESPMAKTVCDDLRAKHGIPAKPVNCSMLEENDIKELLKTVLFEFTVTELGLNLPPWVETLPYEHPVKSALFECIRRSGAGMRRIGDIEGVIRALGECPHISGIRTDYINLGTGEALATVELPRELFYKTLGEQSGFEIADDGDLMKLLSGLSGVKSEYDKIERALRDVREKGYGIVLPSAEELKLEEPQIVKQGGQYGVKLRASAPSIHIVCNERQLQVLIFYNPMSAPTKTAGPKTA